MRRKAGPLILLSLAMLLSWGCSRNSQFTLASTKGLNLVLQEEAYKGYHEGRNQEHILFIFPTGVPSLRRAADEALDEGGGNLLVNADAYIDWWYIPLIYGQINYYVEGDVYDVEATRWSGDMQREQERVLERTRSDVIIQQRNEVPVRSGERRFVAPDDRMRQRTEVERRVERSRTAIEAEKEGSR